MAPTEKLNKEESILLVRSVASCVRNEQDQMILADLESNFSASINGDVEGEGNTKMSKIDNEVSEEPRRMIFMKYGLKNQHLKGC